MNSINLFGKVWFVFFFLFGDTSTIYRLRKKSCTIIFPWNQHHVLSMSCQVMYQSYYPYFNPYHHSTAHTAAETTTATTTTTAASSSATSAAAVTSPPASTSPGGASSATLTPAHILESSPPSSSSAAASLQLRSNSASPSPSSAHKSVS